MTKRAVPGALRTTALLLALACGPSFAATADSFCDRTALPKAPTDLGLQLELVDIDIVNLEAQPDILDVRDFEVPIVPRRSTESAVIRRDMIARERATTILREIFDEPSGRPELSLAPGAEPIADPAAAPAERRTPQPEMTDTEPDTLTSPIDLPGEPLFDERRPTLRDDESLPYRDQMFRTDI